MSLPKPYYEHAGITIFHGDAREILPALSVANAMVVADPPYAQTSLEWDRWPENWPRAVPMEVRSMWCFGSLRMFLERVAQFRDAGWKLSQDIVWEKHNGSSFHNDRFRRVHESICHFYRGEWKSLPVFVPSTADATKRTIRRKKRPAHMGRIDEGAYRSEDGGPRLMRSVLFRRSTHGSAQHPTQKPIELIKPLIHYGGPGDAVVVVPFAGAGSELVAAKQMGRAAIGIEIEERYCEIAAKRLAQEVFTWPC